MGSPSAISQVTWGLLGVVIIALIISVTSLVLVVMKGENGKRIADIESQIMSSTKQREEFDKHWKDRMSSFEMQISSLENLTDHTPPGMVAFSVGSSKSFSPNAWARIPMEIMIYNPAAYFAHDNAFHAPMKGVYSFHFGATATFARRLDMHLYTQKLGETKVHVARVFDWTHADQGGTAGSVMVQMDRGETASVWLWGTSHRSTSLFGLPSAKVAGPTTLFMGKLEYKLD